ncbi:class I SAM-dependent methyltransferase [Promicromonospora sp. NFX87]|uniref:class I SAM-dependent methyltransferase n=1 Tax=Promicromonospora sp. NFX87 TaxID=3402691 RepID=UPI003AFB3B7E
MTTTPMTDRADELRAQLVDGLRTGVRRPPMNLPAPIWAAMLAVPRHAFCPPGTTLEEAYADDVVRTRRNETTGKTTSSVSAPWLQAKMLAQAAIHRGMRVLELGSGGYNASLIAELVGEAGYVVTVDIDQVVVENTRAALAAAGYAHRVTAICADATAPLDLGTFDRIIVTMGVWDIPAAWTDQLNAAGVLVAPLRARHPNECWSIDFHRDGDLLVGRTAFVCGFVDAQGVGALHPDTADVTLADTPVTLTAWDPTTDLTHLAAELDQPTSVRVGSGVVLTPPGMFVGMRTHLAFHLPGLAEITFDGGGLTRRFHQESWTTFARVDHDSLAVAGYWETDQGHELGARGFGPRAGQVATELAGYIAEWGERGQPQRAAHVYRVPGSTAPLEGSMLQLPGGGHLAVTQHQDRAGEV